MSRLQFYTWTSFRGQGHIQREHYAHSSFIILKRALEINESLRISIGNPRIVDTSYSFFVGLNINFGKNHRGTVQYNKAGSTNTETIQIQKDQPIGEGLGYQASLNTLFLFDNVWADHLAWLADLRESIHLVALGRKEPLHEFQKSATGAFLGMEKRIGRDVRRTLKSHVEREGPADLEREGIKGPSSTWSYLVNEDQLGWGVEMLKGTNVGFSAAAAALYGPLFVLALIANRFKRKKQV